MLPAGLVPRGLALQAAWATLLLGLAVAGVGLGLGILNPVILICLLIGAFFGWMYSLPPLKLAWRGWGELDNALLGGLLLHIYGHATLSATFDPALLLICLPFTLLTFNNLLATTWADRTADAQAGKFTLATQLPIPHLRRIYALAALTAFALLLALHAHLIPPVVVYASLLALPLVIWGLRTYSRIDHPYPTSNAMVVLLLAQLAAWYFIG